MARPNAPTRMADFSAIKSVLRKPNGFALLTFWGLAIMILSSPARPQALLKSHSDLVLVPINVIDRRSGLPVRGLKKSDFRLSADGTQIPIAFFQQGSSSDLPRALAIVFDVRGIQGSQREEVSSTFRDQSWSEWLNGISPEDSIAVLRAGDEAELLQDYTSDRSLVSQALMALGSRVRLGKPLEKRPQGGAEFDTQLDDAIRRAGVAAQHFHSRTIKQIVVITGDLNMVENAESERTAQFMQRQDILLNLILVENIRARLARGMLRRTAALQSRGYKEPFVALTGELYAKETGGMVVKTSPAEVPRAVRGLLKALEQGYVAAFAPPSGMRRNEPHRITVTLAKPEGRVEVTYRQGFYLPKFVAQPSE